MRIYAAMAYHRQPLLATTRPPLPFTKAAMESVLLAAAMMVAFRPLLPVNEPVSGAALDQRCFRLMAELAEDGTRGSGPRPDGRAIFPGPDRRGAAGLRSGDGARSGKRRQGAERSALLGQCGDAMQAGGRDFRSIGEALVPRGRPTV